MMSNNCNFLLFVMRRMEFGMKWKSCINECISSISDSYICLTESIFFLILRGHFVRVTSFPPHFFFFFGCLGY